MATTNKVKGWTGVLMTEDSSSHWPTKRRHVYYETSRRAGIFRMRGCEVGILMRLVSGGCKLHICGGRKLHTRHPLGWAGDLSGES